MTILQFIKGPKARIHLTMMISGSKYPKKIYDMSLFGFGVEKEFKFEFKFKFELKQKRKNKMKRKEQEKGKKKRGRRPHGLASGEQPTSPPLGPQGQCPLGRNERKEKKQRGPSPRGQSPRPLFSLSAQARRGLPVLLNLRETEERCSLS